MNVPKAVNEKNAWNIHFRAFISFREQHGHNDVPVDEAALFEWCAQQQNNLNRLDRWQIEKLIDHDFSFRSRDQRWLKLWRALATYDQLYGHTNVPCTGPLAELGRWERDQSIRARSGTMPLYQRVLFNQVDLHWGEADVLWERRYEDARIHFRVKGHLQVDQKKNPALFVWLRQQREHRKKGKLRWSQKRLLNGLKFVWNPPIALWKQRLRQLKEFRRAHGHVNVPMHWENRELARWIVKQRQNYRRCALDPWLKSHLESLGLVWDRGQIVWDQRLAQLRAFHQEHGHCNVSARQNSSLYFYLERLRLRHDTGKLPKEHVQLLEALGFEWSKKRTRTVGERRRKYPQNKEPYSLPAITTEWTSHYRQLVEFREREGHCLVPPEEQNLYQWAEEQHVRADKLHPEQIEKLLEIEFPFRKSDQIWFTSWQALKAYQKANGGTFISDQTGEFAKLAEWCRVQRSRKNQGWMNTQQEFLLNQIGFAWDGSEARWQWFYARAQTYARQHGHFQVGIKTDFKLSSWLKQQRLLYFKSKLNPQRQAQLEAIGFPWVAPKSIKGRDDATHLAALREFHREHGHGNVPSTWPNRTLVQWLARIRSTRQKGSLDSALKAQLDQLGIPWDRWGTIWNRRMIQLRKFHRETGHCRIPHRHKLSAFARIVRKAYANRTIHPNCIRDLDEIGFEWQTAQPSQTEVPIFA